MQVAVLRETVAAFGEALASGYDAGLAPLYQTIAHWRAAWPPASPADLPDVLDAALANDRTRAFWSTRAYFPKEVLLELARFSPEAINLAFGRLFDERADLGDRLSAFVFVLEEVFAEYRRGLPSHARRAHPTHYHADYRAPSLYCALRHPATHAYLEPDVYLAALRALRAPDVGPVADPSRFAKSVRVAMTFLGRDDGVRAGHEARLSPGDYPEPSALLASEYFRFLADAR